MAQITINVCDKCHRQNVETKKYAISREGRKGSIDLCDRHAVDIESLLDAAEGVASPPATKQRRSGPKVVTLDDIEKEKAGASK